MDYMRAEGDSSRRQRGKPPYFLRPGKDGAVSVFRRPIGNRIEPKLCGTMANRGLATALVSQLMRAESVVRDLFLEATDDGIEALEAVLEACRKAVVEGRSSGGRRGRNRNRRRREGPADRGGEPSFDEG